MDWFEAHDKLSGWAQAFGAIFALAVAILLARYQSRVANRRDDSRTAERVRALARMLAYMRDMCDGSFRIYERRVRRSEFMQTDAEEFVRLYGEFNFAAGEVNKFPWAEVPSELVLGAIVDYRNLCSPLANFMSPPNEIRGGKEDLVLLC